jgi:hypothetical protein
MADANKARVQLWVDALRSGEFTQAQGVLEQTEQEDGIPRVVGHCCLGVAQHVALRNGWQSIGRHPAELDWGRAGMDLEIGEWYGFTFANKNDPMLTETTSCVAANDQRGWSFEKIADALEARYINTSTESHDNG